MNRPDRLQHTDAFGRYPDMTTSQTPGPGYRHTSQQPFIPQQPGPYGFQQPAQMPPAPQVIYVEQPTSNTMPVFAGVTAVFSFFFLTLHGTPLALIAVIAWFTSVALTLGSIRSRRSPAWIVSTVLLGLSTLAFVTYFAMTIGDYVP